MVNEIENDLSRERQQIVDKQLYSYSDPVEYHKYLRRIHRNSGKLSKRPDKRVDLNQSFNYEDEDILTFISSDSLVSSLGSKDNLKKIRRIHKTSGKISKFQRKVNSQPILRILDETSLDVVPQNDSQDTGKALRKMHKICGKTNRHHNLHYNKGDIEKRTDSFCNKYIRKLHISSGVVKCNSNTIELPSERNMRDSSISSEEESRRIAFTESLEASVEKKVLEYIESVCSSNLKFDSYKLDTKHTLGNLMDIDVINSGISLSVEDLRATNIDSNSRTPIEPASHEDALSNTLASCGEKVDKSNAISNTLIKSNEIIQTDELSIESCLSSEFSLNSENYDSVPTGYLDVLYRDLSRIDSSRNKIDPKTINVHAGDYEFENHANEFEQNANFKDEVIIKQNESNINDNGARTASSDNCKTERCIFVMSNGFQSEDKEPVQNNNTQDVYTMNYKSNIDESCDKSTQEEFFIGCTPSQNCLLSQASLSTPYYDQFYRESQTTGVNINNNSCLNQDILPSFELFDIFEDIPECTIDYPPGFDNPETSQPKMDGTLTDPEKLIRIGLDRIKLDKTLLYQSYCKQKSINGNIKTEILDKIRTIYSKFISNMKQGIGSHLKVPNFSAWENAAFVNDRISINPGVKVKMKVISNSSMASRRKFNIMMFLLGKIVQLLNTGSTCTRREIFYQYKKFFKNQGEVDTAMKEISYFLNIPPWEVGIFATGKGLVYGNLTVTMSNDDRINFNIKGGLLIPQDCNHVTDVKSDAFFIMIVEKDSIFQKLLDEDLPNKLTRPFIMITGKGFADINTRLFIRKLLLFLKIPVFILVDADPYGIEIMLTYRFGSLSTCHLSEYLAIPNLRWIGIFPSEIESLSIKSQEISDKDRKKVNDLLARPYISLYPKIKEELENMLAKNLKAEIEGVIKYEQFLSDIYLPNKLYSQDYI